jgi:hypothetical protein
MKGNKPGTRKRSGRAGRVSRSVYAAAVALVAGLALAAGATASTTWAIGDVFAGVGGGQYKVYTNGGVFKETISDGLGGFTTGCSFNPALDKLYTTNFSSTTTTVVVYNDASPHAITQTINTGAQGGRSAESIVFAANGDFYVGHADGNRDIQRYNSAGAYQQSYDVATEARGSDWIDLAADQKTMYYTSEGRLVKRYDVSGAGAQLANFATLPGAGNAFALRLLPPGDGSGGLLVADAGTVKRLDSSGSVVQTYDAGTNNSWFALNLDPNGTSFWAGSYDTNTFYRFNIASGAVEIGPIASGGSLFGLCVKGELTAAVGNITLTPATAQNEVGTNHTVTATITSSGSPVPAELVTFSVTAGPNTGASGVCSANSDCTTDSNGQVSWAYSGSGGVGTDTIQACFDDNATTKCTTASKEWIDTNDPPSVNAGGDVSGNEGSAIALDGTVSDPDGDTVTTAWTYTVVSADAGASCSFADATAVDTTITCTDDGTYTATLTGNDGNNPAVSDSTTVTVANVAPSVNITAPGDGSLYQINTAVNLLSSFSDAGTNDTHTCTINWDDGNTTTGAVVEASGTGTCTGSHAYTAPGVYTILVTVTDDDLGVGTDTVMVIVYDPNGGFVTGGGWIDSPAGALTADPLATGRANFGFVSKYKKGATAPDGSTEFQFQAGDLNFHSSSYQWLVVNANGCRAQYKGTGTINGAGSYGFMLWATDGNCTAEPGPDKFRIKIWNASNESSVVYDNGVVYPNGQPLAGGSIVVHKAK